MGGEAIDPLVVVVSRYKSEHIELQGYELINFWFSSKIKSPFAEWAEWEANATQR